MIRDLKGTVIDRIPVENVLISVFDKSGLEFLIPQLLEINPEVIFTSTGGTYTKIKELLGENADGNLVEVAEYTGFPEMEGGLVKTLHPAIHAGILAERNNFSHREYLSSLKAVCMDLVVVNLYPFEKVIEDIRAGKTDPKTGKPLNFESARGNIDIGGPAMIRAAAKNFMGCAPICDPKDYEMIVREIKEAEGCITFDMRVRLAKKVFAVTANYDAKIAEYFLQTQADEIKATYKFSTED